MTFRLRHLLAALILHAVLFTVLVTGVQCSQPPTRPPVIQAVLLDPDRKEVAQQKRQDERRKQEEKRRQDDKRKQDEQRRQEEQKRADEARRKLEVQREADAQRRLEAEKKKALDERKKAEEQARRKQEEEERRERDEAVRREAQERALREEELRREAVAREADREAAQRAETEREKAVALWSEAVQNDVRNAWIRPGGMAEFQCLVRVQQLPDGTVTSAKIVKSCGNPQLDRSVEDAVLRASPLPTISNPAYFLREFAFEFIP